MDFALPAHDDPRRLEVRAWLADHPSPSRSDLAEGGFIAPHWPRPWGRDADAEAQLIIDDEFATAGVVIPGASIGVGWAGPTIIAGGTEAQKDRFLSPMLDDTEDWWLKLSQLGSCMQMVEAFQRSNTRQLIFNSHTQPLLFSAITANAADVSIYDKELELWVTVVVRKVHMSSIKAKRGDNDKYTTITKQTWLRRRSVLNQRSGTM